MWLNIKGNFHFVHFLYILCSNNATKYKLCCIYATYKRKKYQNFFFSLWSLYFITKINTKATIKYENEIENFASQTNMSTNEFMCLFIYSLRDQPTKKQTTFSINKLLDLIKHIKHVAHFFPSFGYIVKTIISIYILYLIHFWLTILYRLSFIHFIKHNNYMRYTWELRIIKYICSQ